MSPTPTAAESLSIPPASPTPTPVPKGSPTGIVYRGWATVTSTHFARAQVLLGLGPCPSSGFAPTTTDANSLYTVSHVFAGELCVTVLHSSLHISAYGWDPASPDFPFHADPHRAVTPGTDEAKSGINFGFLEIIG